MTNAELTSEFEILFEDLATAGSKGLDNYEKSVCYTYAQEVLIRALAKSGQLEPIRSLVKVETVSVPAGASTFYKTGKDIPIAAEKFYEVGFYGSDADKDIPAKVVPQDVIDSMLVMPYQYPPINLVYVVVGTNAYVVFFPLHFTALSFSTRYVDYPTPVILETLTGTDTINGIQTATPPAIDEANHRDLVNAAVQYAISVYIGQQEKEVSDGSSRDKQ